MASSCPHLNGGVCFLSAERQELDAQVSLPRLLDLCCVPYAGCFDLWLMFEHRRRHPAECQLRDAMTELTYIKSQGRSGAIVCLYRS